MPSSPSSSTPSSSMSSTSPPRSLLPLPLPLLLLFTFLLSLLSLSLPPPHSSVYFLLREGQTRCFLEDIPEHMVLLGRYENLDYGLLPVFDTSNANSYYSNDQARLVFTVYSPSKEQMLEHIATAKGQVGFQSTVGGEYSICLQAYGNTVNGREYRVSLSFEEAGDEEQDIERLAQSEHFSAIQVELMKLNNKVRAIKSEQDYLKIREEHHRNVAESVNSRVIWFSVFQVIVVVGGGIFTFWNLRKFFKAKKLA